MGISGRWPSAPRRCWPVTMSRANRHWCALAGLFFHPPPGLLPRLRSRQTTRHMTPEPSIRRLCLVGNMIRGEPALLGARLHRF